MWRAIAGALGGLVLVAGCGGDSGGTTAQGRAEVTVLDTAGVPSAFLGFGVEQGFFEEEGLDVKVQESEGGAEALPAVVSGDVQFAGSNVVSVLLASTEGLDVKIVAPGTFTRESPSEDFSAIMVAGESEIRSARELEGKVIAVNTLKNITEVTTRAALEEEGVDASTLKLRELPFPDMAPAVQEGEVDAAYLIEPFVTQAQQEGMRVVERPYTGTMPGLQVGSYVATTRYIESDPDQVEAFAAAIGRTGTYVEDNPEEFRAYLSDKAELPASLAKQIDLPLWKAESDTQSLEALASLMVEYGLASEEPDVSSVLYRSEQ
ncbi:MAG: ABC transporter substrate-binding protein [Actinomycetota bacterium]